MGSNTVTNNAPGSIVTGKTSIQKFYEMTPDQDIVESLRPTFIQQGAESLKHPFDLNGQWKVDQEMDIQNRARSLTLMRRLGYDINGTPQLTPSGILPPGGSIGLFGPIASGIGLTRVNNNQPSQSSNPDIDNGEYVNRLRNGTGTNNGANDALLYERFDQKPAEQSPNVRKILADREAKAQSQRESEREAQRQAQIKAQSERESERAAQREVERQNALKGEAERQAQAKRDAEVEALREHNTDESKTQPIEQKEGVVSPDEAENHANELAYQESEIQRKAQRSADADARYEQKQDALRDTNAYKNTTTYDNYMNPDNIEARKRLDTIDRSLGLPVDDTPENLAMRNGLRRGLIDKYNKNSKNTWLPKKITPSEEPNIGEDPNQKHDSRTPDEIKNDVDDSGYDTDDSFTDLDDDDDVDDDEDDNKGDDKESYNALIDQDWNNDVSDEVPDEISEDDFLDDDIDDEMELIEQNKYPENRPTEYWHYPSYHKSTRQDDLVRISHDNFQHRMFEDYMM